MTVGGDEKSETGTTPDVVGEVGEFADVVRGLTEGERLGCLDGDAPFWAGVAYLGEGGYHKSPFRAARIDRIGFPGFAFSDGPRGVVVGQATCFPVSMARGATFDPELEERIGEAIGRELRAVGADLFGGICVNVLRHPAWGRAQETYGEDPYLVGEMGAALCRGVQRHAMACVKHLACNSMENARFEVDVSVDEVPLHEVFLPHFRRVVDEGVAVVMSAYNSVNGSWCGESRELLTGILRDEWGFEGFVISDWIFGIRDAAESLHAGLDVEMPYRMIRADHLRRALSEGTVSWSEVDTAVARVIRTRRRFDPVLARSAPGADMLACADHRALAREAAARSVVLLRNEPVGGAPVLPLDLSGGARVALVGALATEVDLGDGGSSDVWAPSVATPEDGLRAALPGVTIEVGGADPEEAAALAASAEVAIVVVGYTRHDEGEYIGAGTMEAFTPLFPGEDDLGVVERFTREIATEALLAPPEHVAARSEEQPFDVGGDRSSLRLHPEDVALIRSVAAANPRTAVALVAGSAVVISEWDREVPAVVQSWYSGMEGGHGLADVLCGRIDPSGRLPFSVPVEEEDLPPFDARASAVRYDGWHGYWHLARRGTAPAYPFGFGLGYTTFLLQTAGAVDDGDAIAVRATVRNTGSRAGSDVVQVYAQRRGSHRPSRLCGFARVGIDPGRSVEVDVRIDKRSLAERDLDAHTMVVRPGTYELRVARHAGDPGIALELDVGVSAPHR
jgi:beta-glucosidase